MSTDANGFYNKFNVTRTDGKALPATASFFILRLDEHGDTEETRCARLACLRYAQLVENPSLEDFFQDLLDSVEGN